MGPPTVDGVSPRREALAPPCRPGIEEERIQAMKQALLGVGDESKHRLASPPPKAEDWLHTLIGIFLLCLFFYVSI